MKKRLTEYEEMNPKMQFIIDSFASYHSPARVLKGIEENFNASERIKINTLVSYKVHYEELIIQRRKEIGLELPIINPSSRFAMAQEIYDMAMDGIGRLVKGELVSVPDPRTALEAVKIAHAMSSPKEGGEVLDSDIIRQVVKETFQKIKEANPKMSNTEVMNLLIANMEEDSLPYINELKETFIN